jgi:hypothetical protein
MDKKKDKQDVLAQELKFAKILASNDQKIRLGVLKSLKEWFKTRSQSSYRKFKLFNASTWAANIIDKTNKSSRVHFISICHEKNSTWMFH